MGVDDSIFYAAISMCAFSNEFFGLISHAFHDGYLYSDNPMLKSFIDGIAVTAAGTIATKHSISSMKEHDIEPWEILADSSTPIALAFVAPTIFMDPLMNVCTILSNHSTFVSIAVGVIFIMLLSSLEILISDMKHYFNHSYIIWIFVIGLLICLRKIIMKHKSDHVKHREHSFEQRLVYIGMIVLLFAGAFLYNYFPRKKEDRTRFHTICAITFGSIITCVLFMGILKIKFTGKKLPQISPRK